jgi:hypothetical protein
MGKGYLRAYFEGMGKGKERKGKARQGKASWHFNTHLKGKGGV